MKQQNESIKQQSNQEQSFDSQQQSSQSLSSEDQVKQKPVFEIIDQEILIHSKYRQKGQTLRQQAQDLQCFQDQGLDEDERQAFMYLLSVRKEKKTLLSEKKKRKSKIQNKQIEQNTSKQEEYDTFKHDTSKKEDEYSECIIKNFNIVVENVKYLIKTTPSYSHNNKKFNTKLYESIALDHQPTVYELIKLTTGQIQDAIRKLSLELHLGPKNKSHIQPNQLPQVNSGKIIKYSLWIYSLLALHQAWSAYKHFETLAQINFVLTQKIKQPLNLCIEQKKSLLILLTLITKVFEQRHLQRLLHQIL